MEWLCVFCCGVFLGDRKKDHLGCLCVWAGLLLLLCVCRTTLIFTLRAKDEQKAINAMETSCTRSVSILRRGVLSVCVCGLTRLSAKGRGFVAVGGVIFWGIFLTYACFFSALHTHSPLLPLSFRLRTPQPLPHRPCRRPRSRPRAARGTACGCTVPASQRRCSRNTFAGLAPSSTSTARATHSECGVEGERRV